MGKITRTTITFPPVEVEMDLDLETPESTGGINDVKATILSLAARLERLDATMQDIAAKVAKLEEMESRVTAIERTALQAAEAEEKARATSPWMAFRDSRLAGHPVH